MWRSRVSRSCAVATAAVSVAPSQFHHRSSLEHSERGSSRSACSTFITIYTHRTAYFSIDFTLPPAARIAGRFVKNEHSVTGHQRELIWCRRVVFVLSDLEE